MIEKEMIKQGVAAGAGKSVPAAKATATGASASAAKAGGTLGATMKATMFSPIFGIVVLAGIITWELWKGSKDAKAFKTA
jgi:hypothetical protein